MGDTPSKLHRHPSFREDVRLALRSMTELGEHYQIARTAWPVFEAAFRAHGLPRAIRPAHATIATPQRAFAAHEYQAELAAYGMIASMSGNGDCYEPRCSPMRRVDIVAFLLSTPATPVNRRPGEGERI